MINEKFINFIIHLLYLNSIIDVSTRRKFA